MSSRIVVLSLTRMGDLVQSTPLLRDLRQTYPQATISIIVLRQFAETAKMLAMIDHVIEFDIDRFVANLDSRGDTDTAFSALNELLECERLRDIDLLINLSHTRQSATLSSLLKPRKYAGLHRDDNGNLIVSNEWITYLLSIMESRQGNPFNLVELYSKLGSKRSAARSLELTPAEEAVVKAEFLLKSRGFYPDRQYVALHPGASHPSRCWHPESFGKLAKRLAAFGYQIVIVGDSAEAEIAKQVAKASEEKAVSVVGETSVEVLASLLAGAQLLISNDTGPAHIAAAVGTRVLALFLGPASAKDTAPYGNEHIILEANLPCAPCTYQQPCSSALCKAAIDVESVLKIAQGILEGEEELDSISPRICVSKTVVDHSGRFRLIKTNGIHAKDELLLEFYRCFWNELLDENLLLQRKAAVAEIDGLEQLGSIFNRAQAELMKLKSALSSCDNHQLEIAIGEQIKWQNSLRDHMIKFSDCAPFIRFLLVKCVLVRTTNIEEYSQDLEQILDWFERGLSLLSEFRQPQSVRKIHAGDTFIA